MAPPEAELAASAGDVEEAAAPLVPGSGARRASAAAAPAPRDVHVLSSAFLFVFLAYHAAQNLQSTVNTDENLGSISLGVLYTSFTAFSAVGSAVVRWMGSRRALVVGTSGYLLFIAANLVPSWYALARAPFLAVCFPFCNCNAAASNCVLLTAAHFLVQRVRAESCCAANQSIWILNLADNLGKVYSSLSEFSGISYD
ncbi:unnamed protein product [Urochloa humidicola]